MISKHIEMVFKLIRNLINSNKTKRCFFTFSRLQKLRSLTMPCVNEDRTKLEVFHTMVRV